MEPIFLSVSLFAFLPPSPLFSSSSLAVRPLLPLLCGHRPSAAAPPCQRRSLLRSAGGDAVGPSVLPPPPAKAPLRSIPFSRSALEKLVEYRITGFPVIDDDWTLVGVVSDYDLLALDSISGSGLADNSMFPEADSTWKTNGKVIGAVMTPAPLVVRETTNLGDAARLLLETKYRRLPVVDSSGKLVGIITRGNVVRAALQLKHANEKRP